MLLRVHSVFQEIRRTVTGSVVAYKTCRSPTLAATELGMMDYTGCNVRLFAGEFSKLMVERLEYSTPTPFCQ
jgi:hypothetical protein